MDADRKALAAGARAARSEFVWVGVGPAAVHAHVARPLVVELDRFNAHSVLDLGCGNGWLTAALARCGFDACGLDSSHSGIAIARSAHDDVPFLLADALRPPAAELQDRFDAIVAVEAVDHVAQPRLLLMHARQMLRPGGLLLLTVPYHGYLKNLGIALSGRFDLRLQAVEDHGRLKFFSHRSLGTLVRECGFEDVQIQNLGRIAPIARSMLLSARRPMA
jgi:2-polyprenyl-3-methyl-5-hydroxy-6-metoxy-1,4-benzoquinol methylase